MGLETGQVGAKMGKALSVRLSLDLTSQVLGSSWRDLSSADTGESWLQRQVPDGAWITEGGAGGS